ALPIYPEDNRGRSYRGQSRGKGRVECEVEHVVPEVRPLARPAPETRGVQDLAGLHPGDCHVSRKMMKVERNPRAVRPTHRWSVSGHEGKYKQSQKEQCLTATQSVQAANQR